MFSRRKKNPPSKPAQGNNSASALGKRSSPSVISADMSILGNIVSDGFVDIDGRIDGNVKAESIIIRANGAVRGDVVAENVQIYGHVEGLVKAALVNLYSSAHVIGSIMHESLSIEDGAFVDGKFKRTDKIFIDDNEENSGADNDSDDEEVSEKPARPESVLDGLKLISH